VKLPLSEPQRVELRHALAGHDGLVASALLRVEAERACARYGAVFAERARAALGGVALIPVDEAVISAAATLEPPGLGTLDAIHLATALSLGSELEAMYVYDARLAAAAAAAGIVALAPA
jgi:predicted nucleic acid-binding protein